MFQLTKSEKAEVVTICDHLIQLKVNLPPQNRPDFGRIRPDFYEARADIDPQPPDGILTSPVAPAVLSSSASATTGPPRWASGRGWSPQS